MNAPLATLDRATYLGSSDIAAILGVSPWATPLDVYLAKMGEAPPITPEKAKLFKRGHRFEPVIMDMFEDETGIEITKRSSPGDPNRYTDPEYPFMAAEIDFEFADGETIANGECKSVHPFAAGKWGEAGTDEVPIEYAAQVMYGLMVTGRRHAKVAALFGSDDLLLYEIERDDETIAAMRAKAVAFWHDHILARKPPEPSNMDDIMRLFARSRGKPVEIDDETAQALAKIRQIRANIAAMNDEKEQLEFQVAAYVCQQWNIDDPQAVPPSADNAILVIDGVTIATWKSQATARLDAKAIRAAHPQLCEQFTRTSYTRPLRFPKS